MARLSEIFDLQMGKTPARANGDYWEDGRNNWVSIADLSRYEKYVGDTKEQITDKAVQESGIKIVPPNTVIMSFKLSLGKTAITREAVYTNEAIMAFIPNGHYKISPDYFFYMLSGEDWSKGTNRAVMGVTLNKATLGEVNVTVPPIKEQQYIASVLDIEDTLGQIARLPYTARAVKKADGRVQAKQQEVEKYRRYKMKLHEDYADGILSREDYTAFGKRYDAKISEAEKTVQALKTEIENLVNGNTGEQEWIEHFKEYRNIRELTRKLAVALIERIEVYEGKRIHILFRFQVEYDSVRILAGNTAVQEETAFQDRTALRKEAL